MDKIQGPNCPPVMHSLDRGYGQFRIRDSGSKMLIWKNKMDLRRESVVTYKHSKLDI